MIDKTILILQNLIIKIYPQLNSSVKVTHECCRPSELEWGDGQMNGGWQAVGKTP